MYVSQKSAYFSVTLFMFAIIFFISSDIIAQQIEATQIKSSITIDGVLNEDEWENCFYEKNQYPDFLEKEWRIYLNRSSEFLAKENEEVILKDKNGLVVDKYSY